MSEALGDGRYRFSGGEEERRVGVPEVVHSQLRNAGGRGSRFQDSAVEVGATHSTALGAGEYQAVTVWKSAYVFTKKFRE